MAKRIDRVQIWNSYQIEAMKYALKLKNDCEIDDNKPMTLLKGGNLSKTQHYSLMTILHSFLAVEARANHLLHEFKENGIIDKDTRDAIIRLNLKYRWKLIPKIAGKGDKIDYHKEPHKAILGLYNYRNRYMSYPI